MSCSSKAAEGYVPLLGSESSGDDLDNGNSSASCQKKHRKHSFIVVGIAVACLALGFVVGLMIRHSFRMSVSSLISCENPVVRHEWRTLSKKEKGAYLQAVLCLRTIPSRLGLNQTLYDDFSYLHTRTAEDGIYSFWVSRCSQYILIS